MLKALIPLLGISPVLIMAGLLAWQKRRLDADARREAITTELRNPPAASLEARREAIHDKQLTRIVSAMVSGMIAGMLILSRHAEVNLTAWGLMDTLIVLFIIGLGLYCGRQIIQDMRPTRQLKQAVRAEQAVAQELAASLAGDNRIIHDIQCGDFNIDHVVVTPAGVFAVETKSRLKPPVGNGSPKVKYNGQALDFGSWKETKPVEQAERQARWLANYLRKETGESFAVTAVLALPGWWIDRTARITPTMVQVINPKNSGWLLLPDKKAPVLDSPAIQRAANAVEKLAQAGTTSV
ncbi:nuclease-related domain-containing protein [Ferribacterium limneticum]|uniref:nuclease-related domain-containing protein n=1 Tax=Ferribacterium limneticum TaxID=76259 RepID=UPI001CF9751F|nr:nuclease-related domain-containing protein [Ferribacterium limneticum]UCV20163.1 NERD domain-containing protein [Ferribacterium limneticum]